MRNKNLDKKWIKVLGGILGGITIAKLSSKYTICCVARGLKKWHEAGIIKYFDGDKEIGVIEAVQLIDEKFGK